MKDEKHKPLKTFGVRADSEKMKTAAKLGIDVGHLFREMLDREISKRQKVCISCGRLKS